MFGWRRAVTVKEVSVLLGCSFDWREQASAGASFVHIHWHFQVASFFSYTSGIREAKKKKMQATHHHTVPWIPRSLVSLLSPLHLSGPFCVWFIYCTGFSVVLSRRNRGRYIYLFHLLEPDCQGLKSQPLHLINVLHFGKLLNLSVPKLPHCKGQ